MLCIPLVSNSWPNIRMAIDTIIYTIYISIIGASVARPPLGVERQLFYIFICIYNIYIYIWCRGHPGYQDPSRRRGCSAAMKRVWRAQGCISMRCRPLPDTYFVQ